MRPDRNCDGLWQKESSTEKVFFVSLWQSCPSSDCKLILQRSERITLHLDVWFISRDPRHKILLRCVHLTVPLSPDNTLVASVFPFSSPHCTNTSHNYWHALTNAPPQMRPLALALSLSSFPPLSQCFLTSLGLEICLSILIPLCQEFWIFITRIHPFFFGNDLEKGGHLLIAHTLLRFDNTFWSR